MTTKPTIVYTTADRETDSFPEVLAVWPAIPEVTENPCIQITKRGSRRLPMVVEFEKADARKLSDAILRAAGLKK